MEISVQERARFGGGERRPRVDGARAELVGHREHVFAEHARRGEVERFRAAILLPLLCRDLHVERQHQHDELGAVRVAERLRGGEVRVERGALAYELRDRLGAQRLHRVVELIASRERGQGLLIVVGLELLLEALARGGRLLDLRGERRDGLRALAVIDTHDVAWARACGAQGTGAELFLRQGLAERLPERGVELVRLGERG